MTDWDPSTDAARLWAAAQALARAATSVRGDARSRTPPLLFFTDPIRTPRPWEIAARMPAGSGVVYRGFGRPEAEGEARRLRQVTSERGMRLLIGLDAALADRVGADGVHLPERALSAAYALSGRRPDWILTGAIHDPAAAATARDLDAVVLSPVFVAGGTSAGRTPLGIEAVRRAVSGPVPVIALGGITVAGVGALLDTGAAGIAAVDGIVTAFGA